MQCIKNACLSWVIWITYAYLPAHPVIFLQEKILKRYVQRHALWDRNGINAVHITWVIVWISGTFQGVVYHRATSCKTKKKFVLQIPRNTVARNLLNKCSSILSVRVLVSYFLMKKLWEAAKSWSLPSMDTEQVICFDVTKYFYRR